MKKRYFIIIVLLLFISLNVKAESCVNGININSMTYRVHGHQKMWLPCGNFSYKGDVPPASCFNISTSEFLAVRVNGSKFQFQPHKIGNATINVSVKSSCLCSGISSLSKTAYFKLSEWGLQNLSVKGYNINPNFYNMTMNYTLTVPYSTDVIEVLATPLDKNSKMVGTGYYKLNVGINKITINVTTTIGDSRNYYILVTREASKGATSIKINENNLVKMHVGTKEKLTYTVIPNDANTNIKWESSYPSVISVVDGTITALKSGTSTITLRDGNLSDSITITAIDKVYDIKTDDNITLYKNDSTKINYQIFPENAINSEVSFTSSDESLFTIDSEGNIKTYDKIGTGTITITSNESGLKKKINLLVKSKLEKIYFDIHELNIKINEEKKLNLNILPKDADVNISYSSSNPNIVSVNNYGLITGLNEGTAKITATTSDNEFSDSIFVNVTKNEEIIIREKETNTDDVLIILIFIFSIVIILTLYSIKKNKSK